MTTTQIFFLLTGVPTVGCVFLLAMLKVGLRKPMPPVPMLTTMNPKPLTYASEFHPSELNETLARRLKERIAKQLENDPLDQLDDLPDSELKEMREDRRGDYLRERQADE